VIVEGLDRIENESYKLPLVWVLEEQQRLDLVESSPSKKKSIATASPMIKGAVEVEQVNHFEHPLPAGHQYFNRAYCLPCFVVTHVIAVLLFWLIGLIQFSFITYLLISLIGTTMFVSLWGVLAFLGYIRDKQYIGVMVVLSDNRVAIITGGHFVNGIYGVLVRIREVSGSKV